MSGLAGAIWNAVIIIGAFDIYLIIERYVHHGRHRRGDR